MTTNLFKNAIFMKTSQSLRIVMFSIITLGLQSGAEFEARGHPKHEPVITAFSYHKLTQQDLDNIDQYNSTNWDTMPDNYSMTCYFLFGTNEYAYWAITDYGIDAQATITFTVPDRKKSYVVEWIPWRPAKDASFIYEGVTYSGQYAQGWTIILPVLTSRKKEISFTTGMIEDTGYFRIVELSL